MCGRFQRLGPNAGGGVERGSGRCLSSCTWSPGWPQELRVPGSAFPVAGRGCATRGLRRRGRRVGVRRRPPTAQAGWRRSRPGGGCSTFLPALAGMSPRSYWESLQQAVAPIAILYGCPQRRVACRVAVGRIGQRCRAGVGGPRRFAGPWSRRVQVTPPKRGQLRPKLRPPAECTPSVGVRASRLQPGLPFVSGPCPGRPGTVRSASDQSLAQLAPLGCSNLLRVGPIANLTRFRVLRLVV